MTRTTSDSTVASSTPQTIGGVERLVERLRNPIPFYQGAATSPPEPSVPAIRAMLDEAASTIEHQLSVIGELRAALENSKAKLEEAHDLLNHASRKPSSDLRSSALRMHNASRAIDKALSSHPIIGDKGD